MKSRSKGQIFVFSLLSRNAQNGVKVQGQGVKGHRGQCQNCIITVWGRKYTNAGIFIYLIFPLHVVEWSELLTMSAGKRVVTEHSNRYLAEKPTRLAKLTISRNQCNATTVRWCSSQRRRWSNTTPGHMRQKCNTHVGHARKWTTFINLQIVFSYL